MLNTMLDLTVFAEHNGDRYRIRFGAAKIKITNIVSDIDMDYFSDTTLWKMGERLSRWLKIMIISSRL